MDPAATLHRHRCRAIIASRRKLESVSATRQSRLEANSAAAIAAHSVVRSPVAGWAACLLIPIPGIAEIALSAVQVSVNPCTVRALPVRDNLVRFMPIVFSCPPERHQRRPKPVWRLPSGETALEVRWGHGQLLSVSRLLWALRRVRLRDQGMCGERAFIAAAPQAIAKRHGEN